VHITVYDLFLDLDFTKLSFKGRLLITLKTEADLVLNSVELDIKHVSIGETPTQFSQNGENLTIATGAFDGTLKVEYSGSIPDSLAGIYRAPYDHTHIVTTHFEAAQARRMLPCVDQPDVKAEFKLTIRIDNDLDAISNMPIESATAEGNKKLITFQKTPRMSTYLLYLGVGKFQQQTKKLGEISVIMATTPGKAKLGEFAQDEARKAIEYYNSYYNIPYELPKVHLIAVPEFAAGAMENWGAITFREAALLIDASSSTKARKRVAEIVDHELAHQWFGDLVTMKWWDDIWLNESFATFMAYKVLNSLHPGWRTWEDFLREETGGALARDCLKNTHPIEVQVKSPEEIEQIFDAISYGKGASILRMIETYIGEETFREGIRHYLSAYAYSNATGNELWSTLQDTSKQQVKKIMTAWIKQPGYPVVTATVNEGRLRLRQERFILSAEKSDHDQTWPIPVTMEVNGAATRFLMEEREQTFDVGEIKSLKINLNRTGFYMVRYEDLDDKLWRSTLTPIDKWGIASDAFAFLRAGKLDIQEYMQLLKKFVKETDYLPAHEVSDQLAFLYTIVPTKFTDFSKEFHQSQLQILQQRSDENSLELLGNVCTRLALVDDEYASNIASKFRDYQNAAPDMKQAIALAYARTTNDFNGLMNAYRKSASDEDKERLLNAMTAFSKDDLIKRTLEFTLSGEVKRQEIRSVALMAAEKPKAKDITWNWLCTNIRRFEELYKGTGTLSGTFMSIVPILGIGRIRETEDFFSRHRIPDAEIGISAGLEKLKAYDRLVSDIMRA